MTGGRAARVLPLLVLILGTAAQAQQGDKPLSAIDWLSDSVRAPANPAAPAPPQSPPGHNRPTGGEAPIANQIAVPQVMATPLDDGGQRAIGARLPADSGLPEGLWSGSTNATLRDIISATSRRPLPAAQDLIRHLMLTRAPGPAGITPEDFALLRVDHLLEIGALEDARALLEAAGTVTPQSFRRYFDTMLLLHRENEACRIMAAAPSVDPSFPARIFCLARNNDWSAAALTLGTARALGELGEDDEALLSRFLDPDLYEDTPVPEVGIVTPLTFRIRDAIGSPIGARGLPIAFSQAMLHPSRGWKAQVEAAEYLSAAGVLAPSRLLEIYLSGRASASGGVWDRVRAIRTMDNALTAQDPDAVGAALPALWTAMVDCHCAPTIAALFGPRLGDYPLTGEAQTLAARIALLAPSPTAPADLNDPDLALPLAIARGTAPDFTPTGVLARAIAEAFAPDPQIPETLAGFDATRTGEALLRALALLEAGRAGDPGSLRDALAYLRHAGQDMVARRAALQILLLDTPA